MPQVCSLEVAVGASFTELHRSISDVLLGPEEHRWTQVAEERNEMLDERTGGGTIEVSTTFASHSLALFSHPHDDCCPLDNLDLAEVPPAIDVYRLLMPLVAIDGEAAVRAWWAGIARGRAATHSLALARLVAKVGVPRSLTQSYIAGEGDAAYTAYRELPVPLPIRNQIMLQGVQGLAELAANRSQALRLSPDALSALVDALKSGMPEVMEVAASAVWSLSAYSSTRAALLKLEVLPALVSACQMAVRSRNPQWSSRSPPRLSRAAKSLVKLPTDFLLPASPEVANRVVYDCLGALNVLAVDAAARAQALKVSPTLTFLSELAALDFPIPQPPPRCPAPARPSAPAAPHPPGPASPDPALAPPSGSTQGSPHPGPSPGPAPPATGAPGPAATATAAGTPLPAAATPEPGPGPAAGADEPLGSPARAGTGGAGGERLGKEEGEEGEEEEEEEWQLPPQDDPSVHQKLAAEALWTMVGRDVHVRRSLALHRGLSSLLDLTLSANGDVGAAAVLCLAAYARDTAEVTATAPGLAPPPLPEAPSPALSPSPGRMTPDPGGAGAGGEGEEGGGAGLRALLPPVLGQEQAQEQAVRLPALDAGPWGPQGCCVKQGVAMLVESGQCMLVVHELLALLDDLLGLFQSGVDMLGSGGHTLLGVMESASCALWGAVTAQLAVEVRNTAADAAAAQRAAQAATAAATAPAPPWRPRPASPSFMPLNHEGYGDRSVDPFAAAGGSGFPQGEGSMAAVAARMLAMQKAASGPPPPPPREPPLTFKDASSLAKLAGQLVALVQEMQVDESLQQQMHVLQLQTEHKAPPEHDLQELQQQQQQEEGGAVQSSEADPPTQPQGPPGPPEHPSMDTPAHSPTLSKLPSMAARQPSRQQSWAAGVREGRGEGGGSMGGLPGEERVSVAGSTGSGQSRRPGPARAAEDDTLANPRKSTGGREPASSSPAKPPSEWLASSLFCVLASLAAVQGHALLLQRVHAQLLEQHVRVGAARNKAAEARNALANHESEVAERKAASKFYFDEADDVQHERLEDELVLAERDIELAGDGLFEVEEALQEGAEHSLAAAQDALRCLLPTGPAVGHAQLAAAAVVCALAEALHPGQTASQEDTSMLFNAPFRPLLHSSDITVDLVTLARSPCCNDPALLAATHSVVASALLHVMATEQSLVLGQVGLLLEYCSQQAGRPECDPYLAGMLWCMCRLEANRKVVLHDARWVPLIQRWLRGGQSALRQDHLAHHGPSGLFYPKAAPATPATAGPSPERSHAPQPASQGRSQPPGAVAPHPDAGLGPEQSGRASPLPGTAWPQPAGQLSRGGRLTSGSSGHSAPGLQGGEGMMSVVREGLSSARLSQADSTLAGLHSQCQGLEAAAAKALVCQVRFSCMALWLLLRQWLVENMSRMNTLANADGLFAVSEASWWTVRFSVDTPLLLTDGPQAGIAMLVDMCCMLPGLGFQSSGLLGLLLSSSSSQGWGLFKIELTLLVRNSSTVTTLPGTLSVVCAELVRLGMADLLVATASSPLAGSSLVRVAGLYLQHLLDTPEHVLALGGLQQVVELLVAMTQRALASAQDVAGRGADVKLMEVAVRGLARLGLNMEGQAALKAGRAVAALVSVVRTDNHALAAVQAMRVAAGTPEWERPQELVSPLRALNGLRIRLGPEQAASAKSIETAALVAAGLVISSPSKCDHHGCSHSHNSSPHPASPQAQQHSEQATNAVPRDAAQSPAPGPGAQEAPADPPHVSGHSDVGLMALWGLLNLSGYVPAQVAVCKHGLYTLLRSVRKSADRLRSSTAAAILANIHFHPDNATTLYKAELKLKYAALLELHGNAHLSALQVGSSFAATWRRHPRSHWPGRRGTAGVAARPAPSTETTSRKPAAGTRATRQQHGKPGVRRDSRDPPKPLTEDEKAAAHAKVSFLQWVLDPSPNTLPELDVLDSGTSWHDTGGMSYEQAHIRLTADPEEVDWLQRLDQQEVQMNGFQDFKHSKGTFLRGTLTRSLAEGAASLWQQQQPPLSTSNPASPRSPRDPLTPSLLRPSSPSTPPATAASAATRHRPRPSTALLGHSASPCPSPPPLRPFSALGRNQAASPNSPTSPATQGPPPSTTPATTHTRPPRPLSPANALRSSCPAPLNPTLAAPSARTAAPGASGGHAAPHLRIPVQHGLPPHGPSSPASLSRLAGKAPLGSQAVALASRAGGVQAGRPRPQTAAAGGSTDRPTWGAVHELHPWQAGSVQGGRQPRHSDAHSGAQGRPVGPQAGRAAGAQGLAGDGSSKADQWRPHVLAFLQDKKCTAPRIYLAQRLLKAGVPPAVTDRLSELAAKLFGNQVLTEGIKAMEERSAADAAFRAAVEQAAADERARMQASMMASAA
ncbi:hypothetical protein QJQ45_011999 [Haematococcus lacustris]|nr:hypothetical protein QJQ45_011999 [Haematococcus lacustris]